jgi:hypothetical protein
LKVVNINEQNNEKKPEDNIKAKNKNITKKKDFNLNNDESLEQDDFFDFLNRIFFNTNIESLNSKINQEEQKYLKLFYNKYKNSKENSLKKLQNFYNQKLVPTLLNNKI